MGSTTLIALHLKTLRVKQDLANIASMPGLQDLPNELQLLILAQPTLSAIDLIRIQATTSTWRTLIHSTKTLQERIFLRSDDSTSVDLTLIINVTIRRVLNTDPWNPDKFAYELTCKVDKRDVYPHLNPVVLKLGDWMHLVNPSFMEDTTSQCALRFSHIDELRQLLERTRDTDASWRSMLVSRYAVERVHVGWLVNVEVSPGMWDPYGHNETITGQDMDMEQLVHVRRRGLRHLERYWTERMREFNGLGVPYNIGP